MNLSKTKFDRMLSRKNALLQKKDPFYGIYMVYDMFGPSEKAIREIKAAEEKRKK